MNGAITYPTIAFRQLPDFIKPISLATFRRLSLRYSPNLTKTLDFPSSLSQEEYSRGVLLIYGFIRFDACKMSSGNKEDILQLVPGTTRVQKCKKETGPRSRKTRA